MSALHFGQALTPAGWRSDVTVRMRGGLIAEIVEDTPPAADCERHVIGIPGMPNLHSHAFQRGMAGLAEIRSAPDDNFWSWREAMYRFALTASPDDVQAIAAQLYVEMLEGGFTRVGEFHYLHHDRDGRPYGDLAEMAGRIAAAAGEAGISLSLLPVFYAHSTFGGAPPRPEQRRFITDVETFACLLDGSRRAIAEMPGATLGVAPHSLRAVTPEELAEVAHLAAGSPMHMHVAEQTKEVEDCLAWSGQRPVDWLLTHEDVDARWCLIHATHMDAAETVTLAASGAAAGLCPITEANLGDGIFDGVRFAEAGGRFGIGSDSNIQIGVADELRQLEYAQRLGHRARNLMAVTHASTGRSLYEAALAGGAPALGAGPPRIATGCAADIVSLDAEYPSMAGRSGDERLDAWIFSAGNAAVDCVWVHGVKRVEGGRHVKRDEVRRRYRAAVARLLG